MLTKFQIFSWSISLCNKLFFKTIMILHTMGVGSKTRLIEMPLITDSTSLNWHFDLFAFIWQTCYRWEKCATQYGCPTLIVKCEQSFFEWGKTCDIHSCRRINSRAKLYKFKRLFSKTMFKKEIERVKGESERQRSIKIYNHCVRVLER